MKNYYLFAYESYRARGGIKDFAGRFENIESVKKFIRDECSSSKRSLENLVSSWDEIQIIEINKNEMKIILSDVNAIDFAESESNDWDSFIDNNDKDLVKAISWLKNKFSKVLL